MFLFASLAVTAALALAPLTERAALDSPYRHVRTQDRSIRLLLKRGFTHSPTFARLMARLEQSDVIVYVEEVPRLPGALEGRMMMLTASHGRRYLRIQLAMRGASEDSIAVLGHELQHAVEVAEEVGVIDQTTLAVLYRRIGTRGGPEVYDTVAAQDVGRIVRKELLA
jgi:hypothetical protein